MNTGYVIGIIGIAICVALCGIGSCIGLYKAASAASGVLGEDSKKYSKLVILMLLPATQGLYGFLIGIIASGSLGAIETAAQGWALFGAVMPMAVTGLMSGVFQGHTAAKCILAVGRQETLSGKLVIPPAMIEFYAILGLIISIILI